MNKPDSVILREAKDDIRLISSHFLTAVPSAASVTGAADIWIGRVPGKRPKLIGNALIARRELRY